MRIFFYLVILLFFIRSLPVSAQEYQRERWPDGDMKKLHIPEGYPTYTEVYAYLDSIVALYPGITHMDTSWKSQFHG